MSAYLGEAQLLGWSESHNSGAKLALALPEPSDLNPFRLMTVKKGKQAGQVLACLIVEMQDHEDPLAALQRGLTSNLPMSMRAPAPVKEEAGPLCKLAAMWCKRPDFQAWIMPHYDTHLGGDGTGSGDVDLADFNSQEEVARHAVCVMCDITSRKQLDHNQQAKHAFESLIRRPFSAYLKSKEESGE